MHINDLKSSLELWHMISQEIKAATKEAHQKLEKTVVLRLKDIRSAADYAEVLKCFYVYFNAIELAIAPFITTSLLPDYPQRRNSSYIKHDIEELGESVNELPNPKVPSIYNEITALGALYVLEGSIMGGPYIVEMLKKYGMDKGFSFFSGYGEDTGRMWGNFTAVMNQTVKSSEDEAAMISTADETFSLFGDVFQHHYAKLSNA